MIYISRQGLCFYFFDDSSAFRLLFGFQKQGIENLLKIIEDNWRSTTTWKYKNSTKWFHQSYSLHWI